MTPTALRRLAETATDAADWAAFTHRPHTARTLRAAAAAALDLADHDGPASPDRSHPAPTLQTEGGGGHHGP